MWQLQTIRTKLLQHISSSSCIAFYKMSSNAEVFVRACSSHCVEPEKACISELLFVKESTFGCALKPLQHLCLSSWRAPPPNPIRIAFIPNVKPYFINNMVDTIKPSTSSNTDPQRDFLDVLVECELENEDTENVSILPVYEEDNDAWKILAWKMKGSHLALALHGDISQLTFLVSKFLNVESPISRIMTVKFDGNPIALTKTECNALSQGNIKGSPRHCSKYVNTLQSITENILDKTLSAEETTLKQNHINHINENVHKTSNDEVVKTEPQVCELLEEPLNSISKPNSDSSDPLKIPTLTARKSDLKLELNNKPKHEKSHSKTVTISRIQALERKSQSRSSLLDEPISTREKSNKGGASCPSLPVVRPPNVLIYSDSAVARENISRTLKSVLDPDRYAIYSFGDEAKLEAAGSTGAALLVAGGALTGRASAALLSALLGGARVLSLCSDLLISVLPYYQTAEVRERELVSFTYENWKSVKLLHHVFCYQASPAKRQFSASSNTHPTEYKGHGGHTLKVEVLAAEQTWHTPSLLRATDDQSGGMAVFSQVHLELDSREYLGNDAIPAEKARLGVLRKILGSLGLSTAPSPLAAVINSEPCYTPAYFLGTYERKQEAAEAVAVGCLHLVLPKTDPPPASATLTPLLLHACPDNFSTLLYFQELQTNHFGRLVIFSEVISSTQKILNEQPRVHGLVVMADRQTNGCGRGGTIWLSPPGCLMFSIQIITSMKTNGICLRAPLMQHLSAVACVLAIHSQPGYEDIDVRIKWPNDIYYGKNIKLGGIVLNTNVTGDQMVFNIGIGINLDNKLPTQCLNDIIKKNNEKLPPLQREKLLALIFNQFESLYEHIQVSEDFAQFYEHYYNYWLHADQEVYVLEEGSVDGEPVKCRIIGIDEHGYLQASSPDGVITLHPDGNSFDMMKGLITPKLKT